MALLQPNLTSQVYKTGFALQMDIVGQNYRENELVAFHQEHPDRIVIGTENTHVLIQWLALRDNPFMSGQFLWTGIDYLGESSWPGRGATSGLIDRTGNWHTNGLQRQAWWSTKPVVHLQRNNPGPATVRGGGEFVSDWTPADPATYKEAKVQVFSNCDETELFLNGKSLGTKHRSPLDSALVWTVTFEKGTLRAVGRNKGKQAATEELKTAGTPVKILLTTDRPALQNNWDDVAYVTASVVDAKGVICPNESNSIQFAITGSGVIAAVDNADRTSHEPYQVTQRQTYKGWCVALIKAKASTGTITIKASAPGLADGSVTINAKP
jgi:beta-galactosidase